MDGFSQVFYVFDIKSKLISLHEYSFFLHEDLYQDVADSPGEKPLHLIIEEFAEYQVLELDFFQDLIFRSQVCERCHIHIWHYPIHVFALVVKDLARNTKESDEWITWSWPWSSSGQLQHFACRTFGLGSSC